MRAAVAAAALTLTAAPAAGQDAQDTAAGCPIELAIYRDMENAASVEFRAGSETATVTNGFRMLLGDEVVLDGFVMWTEEVRRPLGTLEHDCPEGDVTGEEIAACTAWEGVIYTSDDGGTIGLLPPEGAGAPAKLIFAGLGPALRHSSAYGADGFTSVPDDVFALAGCQE